MAAEERGNHSLLHVNVPLVCRQGESERRPILAEMIRHRGNNCVDHCDRGHLIRKWRSTMEVTCEGFVKEHSRMGAGL